MGRSRRRAKSKRRSRRSRTRTLANLQTLEESKIIKLAYVSVVKQEYAEEKVTGKFWARWISTAEKCLEVEDKALFMEFLIGTQSEENLLRIITAVREKEQNLTLFTVFHGWVSAEVNFFTSQRDTERLALATVRKRINTGIELILMILDAFNKLPVSLQIFADSKIKKTFKMLQNKDTKELIETFDSGKQLYTFLGVIMAHWRKEYGSAKSKFKNDESKKKQIFFTDVPAPNAIDLLLFRDDIYVHKLTQTPVNRPAPMPERPTLSNPSESTEPQIKQLNLKRKYESMQKDHFFGDLMSKKKRVKWGDELESFGGAVELRFDKNEPVTSLLHRPKSKIPELNAGELQQVRNRNIRAKVSNDFHENLKSPPNST